MDNRLSSLLTTFQAAQLGDGDLVVGTNQLAAMAITLANLARPGSGIKTPTRRIYEVGCNVLGTGPLMTSVILEELVPPVRRCQNNLLAHLTRLRQKDAAEATRAPSRRWNLSNGPKPNAGEDALFYIATADPNIGPLIGERGDEWIDVVSDAPPEKLEDLMQRPRAFIAATTSELLVRQLADSHLGKAFVVLGLNQNKDAAKFSAVCPAIIDGLIPAGPSGETVGGKILVTAPGEILRELLMAADEETTWLERLLWLVEGKAGPNAPTEKECEEAITLPEVTTRFDNAVRLLFVNRLKNHEAEPVISECDFTDMQARWVAFLSDMERSLPGITGTARRLLASLIFGLRLLVGRAKIPKGFRYHIKGVEALARFLVHRMANARAAILFSAEETSKLRMKRKIFAKLSNATLDNRSIYHPLHLPAACCEELLSEMEADGLVKCLGREWKRIEGTELPSDPVRHLALEV